MGVLLPKLITSHIFVRFDATNLTNFGKSSDYVIVKSAAFINWVTCKYDFHKAQ